MKVMDCWVLLELIKDWEAGDLSRERLKKMIADAPETELERVVRCARCVHAEQIPEYNCTGKLWCKIRAEARKPCEYCSDGIAKEEIFKE